MSVTLIDLPLAITSSIAASPGLGGRDLDHQVGAVDLLVQAHRLAEGRQRVVAEARVDLERDVPVATETGVEGRPEHVAGVLDVLLGERPEDLARIAGAAEQLAQLLVVGVARGHRLLEDRRVRRRADDAVVVDQRLQVPVARRRPGQGVDPHALTEGRQALQW